MLKSVRIETFRGLRNLSLNLKPVTIITGQNNVGKTAALEALFFLAGANSPQCAIQMYTMRNNRGLTSDPLELWGWFFPHGNSDPPIEISAVTDSGQPLRLVVQMKQEESARLDVNGGRGPAEPFAASRSRTHSLVFEATNLDGDTVSTTAEFVSDQEIKIVKAQPRWLPQCFFLTPTAGVEDLHVEQFTHLQDKKEDHVLLHALRIIEPQLGEIRVGYIGSKASLRCCLGSEVLPITAAGAGMSRLTAMILNVISARNGMVLMDEVETGLHHSVLMKVWGSLHEAGRRANTQIIATTHSYECLAAAREAFAGEAEDDILIVRLERRGDDIAAVSIPFDGLAGAIEHSLEIR